MPFLIILGLYLIFKKKIIKLRLGVSLWGFFIMIICFVILSSHWASIGIKYNDILFDGYTTTSEGIAKYLTFSNSVKILEQIRNVNSSPFNPQLGGGYFGFVLAGAINSSITPIGLNAICWIFFLGGLTMLLNQQVKKLVAFLKKKKAERKLKSDNEEFESISLETTMEENVVPVPTPVEEVKPTPEAIMQDKIASKPIYESIQPTNAINNDYSLKKAHFVIPDENIMEDSMVKKIEEVSQPAEPVKATFVSQTFEETNDKINDIVEEETPINEPVYEEVKPAPQVNIPIAPVFEEPEPIKEEVPAQPVDPLHRPQPKLNLIKDYIYPTIDLLDIHEDADDAVKNEASCQARTDIINQTFTNLRIGAQVVGHTVGPAVTRFDVKPDDGVSINTVPKYIDDISMRLGGVPVRFETIVTGKSTSGLEIPNEVRTNVGLRESIAALPTGEKYILNIPFGKGISGDLKYANLADFPHMLVSGTTGSGKSIFVHATILTLIMRCKPDELKLVLIDPKKVEMNFYKNIPHLLCPIISDVKKSYVALKKLVDEMERRYNLFQDNNVREIKSFNAWAKEHDIQPLPYILVFIDEYADLVEQVKEVREPVQRIVQKARAAGIHMVIATQRPSVNVIDGVIKGNVSTRVALMSASAVDSTTIIGEGGAEKLLGNGDMLIDCNLISRSEKPRVQGCFVSDTEITRICEFLTSHYQPQFDPTFLDLEEHVEEKKANNEPAVEAIDKFASEEQQYQDIKEQIMHRDVCSISFIQRSFAMGFPRAGRIFARLIKEGIVADSGDSRGNKVLVHAPMNEEQIGTIEQSTFIPDDPSGENNE